jgi:hypothetical protein
VNLFRVEINKDFEGRKSLRWGGEETGFNQDKDPVRRFAQGRHGIAHIEYNIEEKAIC